MSRSLRPLERENRIAWFFDRTREPLLRPIQCKFCAEKTKQPRGDCWAESLSGQWVCPACHGPQAPDRLRVDEIQGNAMVFDNCRDANGETFSGMFVDGRWVGGRFVDGVFEADGDGGPCPLPLRPLAEAMRGDAPAISTTTAKGGAAGGAMTIWGLLRRAVRLIWS